MNYFIIIEIDEDGNEALVDEFISKVEADLKVAKLNVIGGRSYYVKEVLTKKSLRLFNTSFIDD